MINAVSWFSLPISLKSKHVSCELVHYSFHFKDLLSFGFGDATVPIWKCTNIGTNKASVHRAHRRKQSSSTRTSNTVDMGKKRKNKVVSNCQVIVFLLKHTFSSRSSGPGVGTANESSKMRKVL